MQVKSLQAQLKAEREQHTFTCRQYKEEIARLFRDLCAVEYELVQRDTRDMLAKSERDGALTSQWHDASSGVGFLVDSNVIPTTCIHGYISYIEKH